MIADKLSSKAYRLVGSVLRKNPTPIIIPCHRVVMSSLRVGGYLGHKKSNVKLSLLKKEGIFILKGKVLQKYLWKP